LFIVPNSKEAAVGVYIPIIEAGVAVKVLGLIMPPEFAATIIHRQAFPKGGFGVLIDQKGVIIARTRGQFVGHLAAPGFVEASQKSLEGTYDTISVEGIPIRAAFMRSTLSGWTVSFGMDKSEVNMPLWRALWAFGSGGTFLFAVALLLALYHGRRFIHSLAELTTMAGLLGRGDHVRQKRLRFREAQIIGDQMVLAASALKRQADERNDLLATLEQRVRERTRELDISTTEYRRMAGYARSLLEASLDPLVTINPDGKITDTNKATELVTEQPRDRLIGSDFASYFTEEKKARDGYQQVLTTGFVTDFPLVLRSASGKLIDVIYNASVYRGEAGEVAGIFAAARDVSARKSAERELRRHQENLEKTIETRTSQLTESNAQLEAAIKELEGFSYSVSHDLRTPLRAIDGFSRKLMIHYAPRLDQEGLRLLGVVRCNTLRMSRLIDDILAFSRVGRLALSPTRVDMEAMARGVYKELEPALGDRTIEFKVGTLPEADTDPSMIKRVFTNGYGSATKYSAPNEDALIEVEGHIENHEAVYSVTDNGVGFDMRYVDKLFGVFQRLHGPEQFSGTGIGLSIVKRIIARHGGRVWAVGELGKGASFYFTLPQAEVTNGRPI
jgi:PAS domain S-box-containing protein